MKYNVFAFTSRDDVWVQLSHLAAFNSEADATVYRDDKVQAVYGRKALLVVVEGVILSLKCGEK